MQDFDGIMRISVKSSQTKAKACKVSENFGAENENKREKISTTEFLCL